jgi:POLQ-like helicase
MTPEAGSLRLLGITRSKAKMYEYAVPLEDHIKLPVDAEPAKLFPLAIAILGDYAASLASDSGAISSESSLQFSTRFFDAYLEARFDATLDPYLLLVGAAGYYLNDRPGSSQVLAGRLGSRCPDLGGRHVEDLLHWLLGNEWQTLPPSANNRYGEYIGNVARNVRQYANSGLGDQRALGAAQALGTLAYKFGSAREVLFADLVLGVLKKRLQNSSWACLPRFSGVDVAGWESALRKPTFTRELWPAQQLLGEKGVLRGKSAVVQFPTSAGKTHALEMILRSAFLAGRADLAVVVAPFRALCHEISGRLTRAFIGEDVKVDELSDVLQMDILREVAEALDVVLTQSKRILVVTPEKLLYVLRHSPEISKHVGLLVLDEGHQFDSGDRGVTYELLITALRQLLPQNVQLVLISAVIPNVEQIAEWLIGKDAVTVMGSNLLPTERSVAFSSWSTQRGQLHFVDPSETKREQFFVPRVLEQVPLASRKGEKKKRVFPDKNDGQAIALYLGLKLASQGSIAIFFGRKDSAAGLAETLVDVHGRGLQLPVPSAYSDTAEVGRMRLLHEGHFGKDAALSKCAAWGVYLHHGNTPNGLRIAIEHAMKTGRAKFVICTSTLAQGVNLPIRYLIVTSIYQGADKIRVRDFHNLIGRTGRSGMHTEGTILFSDPALYDRRSTEKWRWDMVHSLLAFDNLEPCNSSLLSLLAPLRSDDGNTVLNVTAVQIVEAYVSNVEALYAQVRAFGERYRAQKFSSEGLVNQIDSKLKLVAAIESYLMSHRSGDSQTPFADESRQLAQRTLAYFLASADQKSALVDVFRLLAAHIEGKAPGLSRQQKYGKTLFGLSDAIMIEDWAKANLSALLSADSEDALLDVVWPLIAENLQHNLFRKCDTPSVLRDLAKSWVLGTSFIDLFKAFSKSGAKRNWGKSKRAFKLDDVVDICENALGYEATLIVGALNDLVEGMPPERESELSALLNGLQKRLRYGLPNEVAIAVHEMGFADRVVAMEMQARYGSTDTSRRAIVEEIKNEGFAVLLDKYPSYFQEVYANITA